MRLIGEDLEAPESTPDCGAVICCTDFLSGTKDWLNFPVSAESR